MIVSSLDTLKMRVSIMNMSMLGAGKMGVPIVGTTIGVILQRIFPIWEDDHYSELWSDLRQRIEYS